MSRSFQAKPLRSANRSFRAALLAGAAALAWGALPLAAEAAGVVEVKYIEPAHFTDIGRSPIDRERVLDTIRLFLLGLGPRLPEGRTLQLDISNIDLAGELLPWQSTDIRVMRGGADWPRIVLRYRLLEGQRVLASGSADLSDMAYLDNIPMADMRLGEQAFEKRMLLKWFSATFGSVEASP